MARKSKHKARLRWVVTMLAVVTAGLCIITSWQDKTGKDLGLLSLELPSLEFLQDFLDGDWLPDSEPDGYRDRDNVLPVSTVLSDARLEVHILNMGQADSILIKGPEATLLIDAGENNQGEDVLRYLRNQGVHQLDYVIGTHPHSDHIGGLDTVIDQIKVGTVILPVIPDEIVPTTQTYTDLLMSIGNAGLKITPAKVGKIYDLGDGATLTILGPIAQYSDLNNMSVVSRLQYGDTSFLFTGDACIPSENDLLSTGRPLRSDVLDIGHHGSRTSSGEAFLQAVNPSIATISCGLDNSYGHPHREVMERLQERGIQVLRTDLNGAIVIASNGKEISVASQK